MDQDNNITWVDLNKGFPSVTIARYGITFNSSATEIINKFELARVGYQKTEKTLVIAMANTDDFADCNISEGWFPVKDKVTSHGYFRLNNKDLVRIIAKYVDLNMSKKNRFMAKWDESKKFIVADMTRKIEKNKKERDI